MPLFVAFIRYRFSKKNTKAKKKRKKYLLKAKKIAKKFALPGKK